MQPSTTQVAHSLAALEARVPPGPTPAAADHDGAGAPEADLISSLPAGLLAELEHTIDVRHERLAEARARIEHGDDLPAGELADRIVGRLVCDRLR